MDNIMDRLEAIMEELKLAGVENVFLAAGSGNDVHIRGNCSPLFELSVISDRIRKRAKQGHGAAMMTALMMAISDSANEEPSSDDKE